MAGMRYSDDVDYGRINLFKKAMSRAMESTFGIIEKLGIRIVPESIGEPAVVFDFLNADHMLAFTNDGVGSKTVVADMMGFSKSYQGRSFYHGIGWDLVAANVNDLICVGAVPFALLDELTVDKNSWFDGLPGDARINDLISGFKAACQEAGIVIPGGETAVMSDVINLGNCTLSGSALGIIRPKGRATLGGRKLKPGDVILGLASNGIHCNGLTLARRIASKKLREGFFTPLEGKTVGEELLRPTKIYVKEILAIWQAGLDIHYLTNITGSGWEKIMRARPPFIYRINYVPRPQPIFTFLQDKGQITDREAYQTWNMGIGLVIFLSENNLSEVIEICRGFGTKVYQLGKVEKAKWDRKEAIIEPLKVVYKEG